MSRRDPAGALYPAIGLPAAIARLRLAAAEGEAWPDRLSALKALGFGSENGTSNSVLNTLRHFGLFDKEGASFVIAPLGRDVLASGPSAAGAMHKAATRPRIFNQLREEFGEVIPDAAVVSSYLKDRGFSATAVAAIPKAYQETFHALPAAGRTGEGANASATGGISQGDAPPGDTPLARAERRREQLMRELADVETFIRMSASFG